LCGACGIPIAGKRPSPAIITQVLNPSQQMEKQKPAAPSSGEHHVDSTSQPSTAAQSPGQAAAGAKSSDDILRRMSLSAAEAPTSFSKIRAANPNLELSENIISATFNIPHSLKYHKGADWVSGLFESWMGVVYFT
jgi:hypothetical protein